MLSAKVIPMKRTVDEKFKYNDKRGGNFGNGYCTGVILYRKYIKSSESSRQKTKEIISNCIEMAKAGDQWSKGVIAGYRDVANERKAKKNSSV